VVPHRAWGVDSGQIRVKILYHGMCHVLPPPTWSGSGRLNANAGKVQELSRKGPWKTPGTTMSGVMST
jgi:hypothetical protein